MINWFTDWWRGYTFGGRSSQWSSTRNFYLKANPLCAVCGCKDKLLKPNEVHHVIPFSVDPSKELDIGNLITLCKDHHLLVGHLMSWSSYNTSVREDAKKWLNKVQNRP